MDHEEAVRLGTTERYALGELSEEERNVFEEHFFSCAECAEDVKASMAFVEEARIILRKASDARRPVRAAGTRLSELFWPIPFGAAATLALAVGFCAYALLVVIPGLRREITRVQAPQATAWFFLSVSRATPQVVSPPPHVRMIGLMLSLSSTRSYPTYRVDVRDAEDEVVLSAVVLAPPAGEELQILLPTGRLRPGPYAIALGGLDSPAGPVVAPDVARYHFTLEHRAD